MFDRAKNRKQLGKRDKKIITPQKCAQPSHLKKCWKYNVGCFKLAKNITPHFFIGTDFLSFFFGQKLFKGTSTVDTFLKIGTVFKIEGEN